MTEQPNNINEAKEAVPKIKVLFADDQPEYNRDCWVLDMRNSPVKDSFDVFYLSSFKNANDAVEIISKNNPDVVFMDSDLKRVDGITGSDIVRALRSAGFTGVIIGNSSSEARPFEDSGVASLMDGFLPSKNLGVRDFLEKFVRSKQEQAQ